MKMNTDGDIEWHQMKTALHLELKDVNVEIPFSGRPFTTGHCFDVSKRLHYYATHDMKIGELSFRVN